MWRAMVEDQTTSIDEVVRKADAAMYTNKRQRCEYERIQEEIKLMSTEENPEILEALRARLQKYRANRRIRSISQACRIVRAV